MRVVIFSGRRRHSFDLLPGRSDRSGYARDVKRFLFPTNGGYWKARRRGERALGVTA